MYQPGMGGGPLCVGGGVCLLPNTGGNALLTFVALTAIVVGTAITLSTIVRIVAKRAYRA
jgi:hypothetical protein